MQPITNIAAYWLLQPLLENLAPKSYEKWKGDEERICNMHYADPGAVLHNRFANDFAKACLKELREDSITNYECIVAGAICAYLCKEYEAMNQLILLMYDRHPLEKQKACGTTPNGSR